MDIDTITRDRGRARLRLLLPEARKIADSGEVTKIGAVVRSQMPYIREENFDALIVYRENGGWYADLVLDNVPDDIPNVIGTPVASPWATREQAEKDAIRTLTAALMIADANRDTPRPEPPPPIPVFRLYGLDLPIDPEISRLLGTFPGAPMDDGTLLAEAIKKTFPDGFTYEAFLELGPQSKTALCLALHLAARSGLTAYP